MAPDDALIMEMPVRMGQEFDILLTPVSRPELGEIRIGEDLFAVGRTEAPFISYPEELTAALSRRHARIFAEHGAVYVADLGSKNGTRINGADVAGHPLRLSDGDELSFGSALSFRVRLSPRVAAPEPPHVMVTLQPERSDLGLQPIELSGFPYLISKADDTFARYRDSHPQQVNYLSRRHAHIYLKCGIPFLEDLGSTNGTFVNGHRLADHGVPLNDGDLIAFGGSHFVYKVAVHREGDADATATRTVFAGPDAVATSSRSRNMPRPRSWTRPPTRLPSSVRPTLSSTSSASITRRGRKTKSTPMPRRKRPRPPMRRCARRAARAAAWRCWRRKSLGASA